MTHTLNKLIEHYKGTDLAMPDNLSTEGRKAWGAIMQHLHGGALTDPGGCHTFYSPHEWEERGEDYGKGSELIVVYDGGDIRYHFALDTVFEVGSYDITEDMRKALKGAGFYYEECTGWYCAIYKEGE